MIRIVLILIILAFNFNQSLADANEHRTIINNNYTSKPLVKLTSEDRNIFKSQIKLDFKDEIKADNDKLKVKVYQDKDFWDILPSIISGMIGLLTILAMFIIDQQNKKRWQKDSLQKYKNDTLINLIIALRKVSMYTTKVQECFNNDSVWIYDSTFLEEYEKCFNLCSQLEVFEKANTQHYKNLAEIKDNLKEIIPIFEFIEDIKINKYGLLKELVEQENSYANISNRSKINNEFYENFAEIDINKIGDLNFKLVIEFQGLLADYYERRKENTIAAIDYNLIFASLRNLTDKMADNLVDICKGI